MSAAILAELSVFGKAALVLGVGLEMYEGRRFKGSFVVRRGVIADARSDGR